MWHCGKGRSGQEVPSVLPPPAPFLRWFSWWTWSASSSFVGNKRHGFLQAWRLFLSPIKQQQSVEEESKYWLQLGNITHWPCPLFIHHRNGCCCLYASCVAPRSSLTVHLCIICDGMGMCCEKKTLIGWRNVWNMRWRAPDQKVDQRGHGKGLCKTIAKHVIRTRRMLWIVVDGRSW